MSKIKQFAQELNFGSPATPSKEDDALAELSSHVDDARKMRDDYKAKWEKTQSKLDEAVEKAHKFELLQASNQGVLNQVPKFHFVVAMIAIVFLSLLQMGVMWGDKELVAARSLDWEMAVVTIIAILILCGRGVMKDLFEFVASRFSKQG